ncbi:MAG: prepilin-type N-terminal cleavage/methylation domain-containing protein [Patescibacteria group bacterium]|nr:prepilin-type N-terminal cleavage/methylation domain-containing protein [Patescibacteria group bacterium]
MQKAFTLNELLITIAIIGLLLIVGIPAFQRFSKSQVLQNSGKDIQNAILEAQSLSLAPRSASGGNDLQGYMIVISQNERSYNIYEIKNNAGTLVKNSQLPDKLKIDSTIAFYFDIAQRGLISFYQQAQPTGDNNIDIAGANFTKIPTPQKTEIKIDYIDSSTLPGRATTVTVYPETALIEVKS